MEEEQERRGLGLSVPPAARGSAATYSQPAPAVREGGGGDALTFLSLELQASDFPTIPCLLLVAGELGDTAAACEADVDPSC